MRQEQVNVSNVRFAEVELWNNHNAAAVRVMADRIEGGEISYIGIVLGYNSGETKSFAAAHGAVSPAILKALAELNCKILNEVSEILLGTDVEEG